MMRELIDIEDAVFIAMCAVQDMADENDISYDEDHLRDWLMSKMHLDRAREENEF